tara:strand:+ start:114 stop:380 length:267 start_codon:yes stop_codon:yes gene_type:complete
MEVRRMSDNENDEGGNFLAANGHALYLGRYAKKVGSSSEEEIYNLAVTLQRLGLGTKVGILDLGNRNHLREMLSTPQSIEMFVRESGV